MMRSSVSKVDTAMIRTINISSVAALEWRRALSRSGFSPRPYLVDTFWSLVPGSALWTEPSREIQIELARIKRSSVQNQPKRRAATSVGIIFLPCTCYQNSKYKIRQSSPILLLRIFAAALQA